jgi:uncharacterized PurR-regulated membrane protein YhhQ (DUF165 family)
MFVSVLYIGCIIAANILAAKWTVPLPFGLAVPAGVFAIAPVFSLRDEVHEKWGRKGAYALIAVASAVSWGLALLMGDGLLSRVTLASVAAFALNETMDTEVYHKLRERSRLWAILGSNAISSLVDSGLFIWVAFGPLWNLIIGQYIVKMLIAAVVGLWIARRSGYT